MMMTGILLLIGLAAGLADPPLAGSLQWQADSPSDWVCAADGRCNAPHRLPPESFTLELSATGETWGLWLATEAGPYMIWVNDTGYFAQGLFPQRNWIPFPHLGPDENTLYLHQPQPGSLTLRFNQEIAWEGALPAALTGEWGIITASSTQWQAGRLYAPDESSLNIQPDFVSFFTF